MKQLKTRFITLATLAVIFLYSSAMRAEIIITADSDTTVKVASVKSIAFDGDFKTGNLVINFVDGSNTSTPVASIKQISMKSESTDETSIADINAAPTVAVSKNMLFITADGGRAAVYDAAGRLLQSVKLSQGTTTLSLAALPNGVYIININGHSIKLNKQ